MQISSNQLEGSNSMGKNVTIYLPDEVAENMEKFPEVNWSEICRQAILDYIETRSRTEIAPILERLKKERNDDYKQGQIVLYEKVFSKLSWKDFEEWHERLNKRIVAERPRLQDENPLSPEMAELLANDNLRKILRYMAKQNAIEIPQSPSDSFCEGAIDAFMHVYDQAKSKHPRITWSTA